VELYDDERGQIALQLIKRFPNLEDFYKDPATAVFIVKIKEYSITSNFQQVLTIKTSKEFCV
jgi:hypothetical protein